MPWTDPRDALNHTYLADTPARQRQWMHIANGVMKRGGSDKLAIETANGVLKKNPSKKKA